MKINEISKFVEQTLSQIEKTKKDYKLTNAIQFQITVDGQLIIFDVTKNGK